MLKVEYTPTVVCWAYRGNGGSASSISRALLAVADGDSSSIRVYDPEKAASGVASDCLVASLNSLHRSPVKAMCYSPIHDAVISGDAKGSVTALNAVPTATIPGIYFLPLSFPLSL